MTFKILEWVNSITQCFIISNYFVNTLQLKIKKIYAFFLFGMLYTVFYLATYRIVELILIKFLFFVIEIAVCVFLFSKNTVREKIIIVLGFVIMTLAGEVIGAVLYSIMSPEGISGLSKTTPLSAVKLISSMFFSLLFFSFSMIFTVFWNKLHGWIKYKLLILFLILPASQIIFLIGMYYNNYDNISENILIFGTICLVVSVISDAFMYMILNQATEFFKKEQEFDFIKMQRKLQYEYYQLATANATEAAMLKHEIKNQLQTAYALFIHSNKYSINDENHTKAVTLVREIEEKVNLIDKIVYCENPIVNTILAIKTLEAKNHKIETDIHIENIENIIIANMDICSIFSNLYDNAIEACIKNTRDQNWIHIKAGERMGYLVIKFSNTCAENVKIITDGDMKTTKADKKLHGYGMKLIRIIAKKYEGDVMYSCNRNVFEVTVSLKINLKIF